MYTKKLLQLVALLVIISTAVFAQTTNWTGGAGNSDWNNTLNWDHNVPDQYHDAYIPLKTYMPILTGLATCKNLVVTTGTLTFSSSVPSTMTIAGTTAGNGNVTIQSTGTIFAGIGYKKVAGYWSNQGTYYTGTGSTIELNGNGNTQTLDATGFYNLVINKASGSVNLNSGTFIIGNQLTLQQGILNTGNAIVNFNGNIGNPFNITGGTFNAGTSTMSFETNVTTSIPGNIGYYNLDINRSAIEFDVSASMTVANNLSVTTGKLVMPASTSITLGGDFTITDADGSTAFAASAPSTIVLNGNGIQNIPLVPYDEIAVTNPSSAGVVINSANGGTTVSIIKLTIGSSSTFSDGGNQIYLGSATSTLVMSGSGHLTIGSGTAATTLNPSLDVTGMTGGTVEFASTSNQTVTVFTTSYPGLTLSGAGSTKLINGSATITGTLLVSANVSMTIVSGAAVTSSGTLTNNGTITDNQTLNVNGTTGTQLIGGQMFQGNGNLTFGPTGGQTVKFGNVSFTGTTNFNNANVAENFVSSSATIGLGIVNLAASSAITPADNWTCSGELGLAGTASLSIGSTITLNVASLNVTGGGTISNAGNLYITGGRAIFDHYSGAGLCSVTPKTTGDVLTFAAGDFTSTGNFTIAGSKNMVITNAPTSVKNLSWNNTGTSTILSAWTITNDLTIASGATLPFGSSITMSGGSITETGQFATVGSSINASLVFTANAPQTWTLGGVRNYSGITLDLSSRTGAFAIKGFDLTLNRLKFGAAGSAVNMDGHNLSLLGGAAPGYTGSLSAGAHVWNGTVASTVLQSTTYTFPVGTGTALRSFAVTYAGTSPGVTQVGYWPNDPNGPIPNLLFNYTSSASVQVQRASAYYWSVTPAGTIYSSASLNLNLAMVAAQSDPFQTVDKVRLIALSGSTWSGLEGTYNNVKTTEYYIDNVVVTGTSISILGGGSVKIALGLTSAVVPVSGYVYYGDLSMADVNNRVGGVTVTLTSSNPVINATPVMIASGAGTGGYSFGPNISGITVNGYVGKVDTSAAKRPAWATISPNSSSDAVAARNTVVGRTSGAITASETMRIIAADVDASGGTVTFAASYSNSVGGDVQWNVTPPLTSITGIDVMQILQKAAGNIGYLPNNNFARGEFFSTQFTTNPNMLSSYTNQNIRVIAIGDCSAPSGVPTVLKKKSSVEFASVGSMDVDSKTIFSVPIKMKSENVEVAAFTIAVKYPADKVEFKGVVSSIKGITAVAVDGYVRMSWIDMSAEKPVALAKDAEILSVKFQPKGGFNSNSAFDLELDAKHTSFSNNDAEPISLSLTAQHVGALLPTEFSLSQNYPNPFNPTTTLDYAVPEMGKVSIKVYNILGQVVTTLFDGVQEPGRYHAVWNANHFASGVYVIRMTGSSATKNFSSVVKLMLLK